jgi:hypothetical protein
MNEEGVGAAILATSLIAGTLFIYIAISSI